MEQIRKVQVECTCCKGSGDDPGLSRAKATCPKCKGSGKIQVEAPSFRSKAIEK